MNILKTITLFRFQTKVTQHKSERQQTLYKTTLLVNCMTDMHKKVLWNRNGLATTTSG